MRLVPVLVLAALVSACGGGDDGGTDPTPTPASVSISPTSPDSLFSGGATVQLNATVRDDNDDVMPGQAVTWSTSNAAVANVSGSGLVTAAAVGNVKQPVTITATVVGHPTITSSVTIGVRQKAASLDLTPDAATLDPSATRQLTATIKDARGVAIAGLTGFTYGSTNTDVATVSGTGLVTAGTTPGTAKVGASLTADGALRTDSTTITVAGPQSTANVATAGFSFVPQSVTITRSGGSGQVNWALAATHNVTWDNSAPAGGNIATCGAGTCNESRTFTVAGTYNYHCSVHGAAMNGTVVVQ